MTGGDRARTNKQLALNLYGKDGFDEIDAALKTGDVEDVIKIRLLRAIHGDEAADKAESALNRINNQPKYVRSRPPRKGYRGYYSSTMYQLLVSMNGGIG